jgi:hypothetical protein
MTTGYKEQLKLGLLFSRIDISLSKNTDNEYNINL